MTESSSAGLEGEALAAHKKRFFPLEKKVDEDFVVIRSVTQLGMLDVNYE